MLNPIARDVELIGRISAVPKILQVLSRTTGMQFTAVARVTDEKWVACAVFDQIDFGLKPGGELVLGTTICNEIRQHRKPVIFGHASQHPDFCGHPTPKMYGFESYVSIPIFRADGEFFGTLCAIDPKPARLDEAELLPTLQLFTELISAQLETEDRLDRTDAALLDARETAHLREQFIAVLGHDLRSPLHSIQLGARLLKSAVDARLMPTADRILRSTGRMTEMVDNILDFARGRLGGGMPATLVASTDLGTELRQVLAEVHSVYPERALAVDVSVPRTIVCDRGRLGQLVSNLVSNAMSHGDPDQPVRVSARVEGDTFELAVHNRGPVIPPEKQARLFRPFSRTTSETSAAGLGLGLYIAHEIARAHRGTLSVTSSDAEGTRFVLQMPAQS